MENISSGVIDFLVCFACGCFITDKIFNYIDLRASAKVELFIYKEKINSLPLQYVEIKDALQNIKYSNLKTGLLSNMVYIEIQDVVDSPTFRFVIYKDIYVKIKENNGFIQFCGAFYSGKPIEDFIK